MLQQVRSRHDAAPRVILSVRGGAADVIFKPKGINVTILDYDVDGAEEDDPVMSKDPDGRVCCLLAWVSSEKVAHNEDWPMVKRAARDAKRLYSRRWRCPGCRRVVDYSYEQLAEAGSPCCCDCDRDMRMVRSQKDVGPTPTR